MRESIVGIEAALLGDSVAVRQRFHGTKRLIGDRRRERLRRAAGRRRGSRGGASRRIARIRHRPMRRVGDRRNPRNPVVRVRRHQRGRGESAGFAHHVAALIVGPAQRARGVRHGSDAAGAEAVAGLVIGVGDVLGGIAGIGDGRETVERIVCVA